MPYRKVYHHVRRHRKKYWRFVLFFLFLLVYGIIEDVTAMSLHGIELNLAVLTTVSVIALVFTTIAELTEKFVQKKEPQKIAKFIRKKEKIIKKDGKIFKEKLKKI